MRIKGDSHEQASINFPTGGAPHPHNQAEVLEVLRGPSNLRCMSQKSVAFVFF